jgi:hypothetical protein
MDQRGRCDAPPVAALARDCNNACRVSSVATDRNRTVPRTSNREISSHLSEYLHFRHHLHCTRSWTNVSELVPNELVIFPTIGRQAQLHRIALDLRLLALLHGRARYCGYLESLPPMRIVRLGVILLCYCDFSRECEDGYSDSCPAAPACARRRPCRRPRGGIPPPCSPPVLFPPDRSSLRSSLRWTAALSGYPRPENRAEATPRAASRGSAGSPAGRLPLSQSMANPWTRDHAASAASCESGADSEAAKGATPR